METAKELESTIKRLESEKRQWQISKENKIQKILQEMPEYKAARKIAEKRVDDIISQYDKDIKKAQAELKAAK